MKRLTYHQSRWLRLTAKGIDPVSGVPTSMMEKIGAKGTKRSLLRWGLITMSNELTELGRQYAVRCERAYQTQGVTPWPPEPIRVKKGKR